MLSRFIDEVRTAPEKLTDRSRTLRQRAHTLRGDGQERLWELKVDTLERVETLLDRPASVPVLGKVAQAAERLVHRSIETATALPIDAYDEANAKTIIKALDGLDRIELLRVRRHERAGKQRKTVLSALDKALDRLDQPVVDVAA